MAFSGCACLFNCMPKCTSNCHGGNLSFALDQPTSTIGVSTAVLNSPRGVVAKFVDTASTTTPTAAGVSAFNPAGISANVSVTGGNLSGSTGIAVVKVLNSNNQVLKSRQFAYTIAGSTIYLQNPSSVKSWMQNNASALINNGAQAVKISANIPILKSLNSSSVNVKTTINYDATSVAMLSKNFRANLSGTCSKIKGVTCERR